MNRHLVIFFSYLLPQIGQDLLGVGVGLDLGHDLFDDAVPVNEVGAADNAHADLAVVFLLLPCAVSFDHGVVGVGQQHKGQVVFLGKLQTGCNTVLNLLNSYPAPF